MSTVIPKAPTPDSLGNPGTSSPRCDIKPAKHRHTGVEVKPLPAAGKARGLGKTGTGAPWA